MAAVLEDRMRSIVAPSAPYSAFIAVLDLLRDFDQKLYPRRTVDASGSYDGNIEKLPRDVVVFIACDVRGFSATIDELPSPHETA